MTLKEKRASDLRAEATRETCRGYRVDEKEKRWVGILLALVGALTIAMSARDTLAGVLLGGDERAPLGSSGEDYLVGSKDQGVMYASSGGNIVVGGKGDDEIFGGPGQDLLIGGSGDDFIEASDGNRDYVSCGPGYDVVDADGEDAVADDCELVHRR